MLSKKTFDRSCTFRQTFNSVIEALEKKVTVTGVLNVLEGVYNTSSQNQKLTFTDTNLGNFGTGVFSVRIIAKIGNFVSQSSGTINSIISKGTAETNGFTLDIKSDNKLYIYTVGTGGKAYDTIINDNKFHDIIITRNGTSLICYVDGIQRLTVIGSGATVSSGSLQLGGDSTITKYSNTSFKLVELYNKELTSGEITTLFNNSKYKGHTTIQGNIVIPSKLSSPINLSTTRSVIDFEQNIVGNNYVTVADNTSLNFGTGSFSIYWEDSYPQRQSISNSDIIAKDNITSGSWTIDHTGTATNSPRYLERGTLFTTNNMCTLTTGNYKFLLVRSAIDSKIHFFVNGVEIYTSSTFTFNNLNSSSNLLLKSGTGGKTSGSFKNLKIWKGQAITWNQIKTLKTGLVLDLPLDEGQGLICYDRSGNNNNGTITSTFPLSNWTKNSFPLDNKIIDWSFQKASGTNIVPKGMIGGTGSYKLVKATSDLGTYKGVKKGENYLECTVAGTITIPNKQAYGTWEFDLYQSNSIHQVIVQIINSAITTFAGSTSSYSFLVVGGGNALRLYKGLSSLLSSSNSYVSTGVWYRIKITRSITGVFTVYIKGEAFGNNYILVSTSGGSGANPVTDNTYSISNFTVIQIDVGDRIGKIIQSSQVY